MRRIFGLLLLLVASTCFGQSQDQARFFRDHCLFIHDGFLKQESASPSQVLAEYEREGKSEPIVIHFHGGLVSEGSARKEALDLNGACYGARSYPIFLAWNADLFTELGNLLEARYHNAAYAQGHISTAQFLASIYDGVKSNGLDVNDLAGSSQKLMAAYRRFMKNDASFQKAVRTQVATDDDDILGSGKTLSDWENPETWRKAKDRIEHRVTTYFRPYVEAFLKYHDANSVSWGGDLLEWVSHNLGGRDIWSRMKRDTALSFTDRNGVQGAGLQLLYALRSLPKLPRIVLVGHSTGCIYITNFLSAAHRLMPGAKFDVVFLAPANTYQDTARFLASSREEINNFRMFGIRDVDERRDHMLWQLNPKLEGIYPGSLLVYVSRAVESRRNMPLLGLQRDFMVPPDGPDRAASLEVHRELLDRPGAVVWSPSTGSIGYCSNCVSHGDFCSDAATLISLRHLVSSPDW
jgi:hypothetical protein